MRTAVTRPVLWPREQPASPARRCVRRAGGVHENSDARYGGTRRPPDGRRRRHRPPHPEVFATSTTRQPCHQPPGRVQLAGGRVEEGSTLHWLNDELWILGPTENFRIMRGTDGDWRFYTDGGDVPRELRGN